MWWIRCIFSRIWIVCLNILSLNFDKMSSYQILFGKQSLREICDFGVTFDDSLSLTPHVHDIVLKANQMLTFIKRLPRDFALA